jgi:hypothetical protein
VSLINTILKPDVDGTLHLPIPLEWRGRPIRVSANLEPVESSDSYSTEWQELFGSIEDETFKAPERSGSRSFDSFDKG